MLSTKFLNYLYITNIEVNDAGTFVKGRATTSRKATEYDKKDYKGYVQSSWFIKFAGKETVANAMKLKKGDKIIVPNNGFSITTGEEYADKKYSPTVVQIWEWSYNDGGKKKDSSEPNSTPEDGDDSIPF